jgi:hypothetical protein
MMNYYKNASDLKAKCSTNFNILLSSAGSKHIDFNT